MLVLFSTGLHAWGEGDRGGRGLLRHARPGSGRVGRGGGATRVLGRHRGKGRILHRDRSRQADPGAKVIETWKKRFVDFDEMMGSWLRWQCQASFQYQALGSLKQICSHYSLMSHQSIIYNIYPMLRLTLLFWNYLFSVFTLFLNLFFQIVPRSRDALRQAEGRRDQQLRAGREFIGIFS